MPSLFLNEINENMEGFLTVFKLSKFFKIPKQFHGFFLPYIFDNVSH